MRLAFYRAVVVSLFLLAGAPAFADPVTVTSGFARLTDEPGDFSLVGSGFELSGSWFPRTVAGTFWYQTCGHPELAGSRGGCTPGSRIDFGTTTYALGGDPQGSGVIGGVAHDRLYYSGEWTFVGPTVTGPDGLDDSPLVREGAFAFQGSIAAFLTEDRTGTPLFSTDLRGSGTARVFFGVETAGTAGPRLVAHDLDYIFETPQAVPEPSSMLLVAAGIAAGLNRVRRRKAESVIPNP